MRSITGLFVLCCLSLSAAEVGGIKELQAEQSFKDIITKLEFREQKQLANNVTVECDVKVDCLEEGKAKKYDLSSTIIGFATGQLRLKVNYSLFSVMDLAISTSNAILVNNKDKIAYTGTVQDAKNSCHVSRMAASEFGGNKFLFPEIWDERASSRVLGEENGQPVVYVFRRQEGKEEVLVIKKVYLEAYQDTYIVRKTIRYNDDMVVCGIIEYDSYQTQECEVKKKGNRKEFIPTKVTIKVDSDTTFAFSVTKVKLDKEDDANKAVKLQIPEGMQTKSFTDLATGQ